MEVIREDVMEVNFEQKFERVSWGGSSRAFWFENMASLKV